MQRIDKVVAFYIIRPRQKKLTSVTSDSEYTRVQFFLAGPSKPNAVKNLMCIGVRSKMDAKVLKFYATLNTHISGVLEAF